MRIINKIKIGAFTFLCGVLIPFANAQISTTPLSLSNFKTYVGMASTPQALTINATGPLDAFVAIAPRGYEISSNASTGFGHGIITIEAPLKTIQSVYRGNFSHASGAVWDKGNGREFPNARSFAAITSNGAVVTWGSNNSGGDSSAAADRLRSNVTNVYSNSSAFAALKSDGSVVTWGIYEAGGNSSVIDYNFNGEYSESSVADRLSSNVTAIFSNQSAFAALKSDGSVVTWGEPRAGGNASVSSLQIINDDRLYTYQSVAEKLSSNVTAIYSNANAFAALKSDGSVVTWGDSSNGGDSNAVASRLSSNVTAIYSNANAFAALKSDGSVVTWGNSSSGGSSSHVSSKLSSNVTAIFSNESAFAALKSDGSVVTWGSYFSGGNASVFTYRLVSPPSIFFAHFRSYWSSSESSSVAEMLRSSVTAIYSNKRAFAALKSDGSVVTWGDSSYGGDSTAVADQLSSNVTAIYSNQWAFAALKSDGSVVHWGHMKTGDHVTISTSGSQRQIFVRLVGDYTETEMQDTWAYEEERFVIRLDRRWTGEELEDSVFSGDLVLSSLKSANYGVETKTLPLFGTVWSSIAGFTGVSDNSGGGEAEVKKSKKGKGKSSAKKAGGVSKKLSASKPKGGKKPGGGLSKQSGGKKKKKK